MSESERSLPESLQQRAEVYRKALSLQNLPIDVSVDTTSDSIKVGPEHTLANHSDSLGVKVEEKKLVSHVETVLDEQTAGTPYEFIRFPRSGQPSVIFHEDDTRN